MCHTEDELFKPLPFLQCGITNDVSHTMCRYLMIYLSWKFHKPRSTCSLATVIKLNAILFNVLKLYCHNKCYVVPRPIRAQRPVLKISVARVASAS